MKIYKRVFSYSILVFIICRPLTLLNAQIPLINNSLDVKKYFTAANFSNDSLFKESEKIFLERQNIFNSIKKLNDSGSVLDSVVYFDSGYKYKHIYKYIEDLNFFSYETQYWDRNQWQNKKRYTSTYDDYENMIIYWEVWDNNIERWGYDIKYTYSFDNNGNIDFALSEKWIAMRWENNWRQTRIFDDNNNLLTILSEDWDMSYEKWINDWCSSFTYDSLGNEASYLYQDWDIESNQWVNDQNYTYTYYNNGNIFTHSAEVWDTLTNQWINEWRYQYTYDENNNILTQSIEDWDIANNNWQNQFRYTFTYDSDCNVLTKLDEEWETSIGNWINHSMDTYTYDIHGNKSSFIHQYWNSDKWEESNKWRFIFEYDGLGYITYFFSEEWSQSTLTWSPKRSFCTFNDYFHDFSFLAKELYAYYHNITGMYRNISSRRDFLLYQNYPNPFNPKTTITYELESVSEVTLTIYDSKGCKVKTIIDEKQISGKYSINFDASKLASGIYFYKLKSGNFEQTRKMILLR